MVRCMYVLPSRAELIPHPHRDPFTFGSANGTHQPGLFLTTLWRPLPPASSSFSLQHAFKTTAFCDACFPDSSLLLTSTHTPWVQTLSSSYFQELSRHQGPSEDLLIKDSIFSWADVQEALRPCICCHCLLQILQHAGETGIARHPFCSP